MNLVIVESPTKARTIGRFLGKEYEIKASMGHVMDLPKSTLGVDVEHDFAPQFELMPDKEKAVSELKSAAKASSNIIFATDPDREGEAIAFHVAQLLKVPKDKIKRIVFHEITKDAIEEALKTPRHVDVNLVDAQTARRVLDRLVGYKLSPLLWKKVRRGLSAGRVQSVAVRLIVEREREIEKFKKEQYYTVFAVLRKNNVIAIRQLAEKQSQTNGIATDSSNPRNDNNQGVQFELIEINGEKIEIQDKFALYDGEYKVTKTTIDSEKDAQKILDDLKTATFIVSDVSQKEIRRSPQPPYTTSTLQQDAARRLGLNGKRTMGIAQKLYEEGYITYHRTDSVVIAKSAQFSIIAYVKKEFGENYVPEKPRFYATKQKLAQEAHEAIRPTKVSIQPSAISNQLGSQYGKLYELIWRRAVASQMSDAVIESTTVYVDVILSSVKDLPVSRDSSASPQNDNPLYRFKTNGSVLLFDGFLKVNPQALQDTKLPQYKTQEELDLENAEEVFHETPPPPRYNDASIIKTLEEKGIGRPSTYATIVSTIESRRYIEREEGRFMPTPVGVAVNDFLVKNFSDIDDIPFTAEMEDDLDNIAHGKKEWEPMIKAFYHPFEKKLEKVEDARRVKIEVEETNEKCPKCGSPLVIRTGKFGKFLSCSTFPECDFKKSYVEETGFTCPKDGGLPAGRQGKVIVKKTRKGRIFYGCSNYPACTFATWKLEDIKV